jgi:hypothetical protein
VERPDGIDLESTAATPESVMADFEIISTWTKDISKLTSFDIVQLVKYLIDSRNKTYDKERLSMKACKSLKAYKTCTSTMALLRISGCIQT